MFTYQKYKDEFTVRFDDGVPDWITFYENGVITGSEPIVGEYYNQFLEKLKQYENISKCNR